MKKVGFEYKVYGQVVFTGKELWLLKQCADSHYDHACRTCFGEEPREPYKNFGKVWIQADLLWQAYRRRRGAGGTPGRTLSTTRTSCSRTVLRSMRRSA